MAGSQKRGRQTQRNEQLALKKVKTVRTGRCTTCTKRCKKGILIDNICTGCLGQQNDNEPVPAPLQEPVEPATQQEPVEPATQQEPVEPVPQQEPAPLQEAMEAAENSTLQAETVEHVGPTTRARARACRGIRVQPNELEQAPTAGWRWNSCNIL